MTQRARRLPEVLKLSDGVVTLRPWTRDDVDDLARIWQDPELQRRFGVEAPVSTSSCAAYVDGVGGRWRDGLQVSLAVVAERRLIGGCDLDHLDTDRPDLGYWLAPAARGEGYATRACGLILDWAAADLDLDTLCIEVEPDNTASIAVAERLGFSLVPGVEGADGERRLLVYERRTISR